MLAQVVVPEVVWGNYKRIWLKCTFQALLQVPCCCRRLLFHTTCSLRFRVTCGYYMVPQRLKQRPGRQTDRQINRYSLYCPSTMWSLNDSLQMCWEISNSACTKACILVIQNFQQFGYEHIFVLCVENVKSQSLIEIGREVRI